MFVSTLTQTYNTYFQKPVDFLNKVKFALEFSLESEANVEVAEACIPWNDQ